MSIESTIAMVRTRPDVSWEIAPLLPRQGEWSESDYFWLTNRARHLIEFSSGHIEVLPMPTEEHQRILMFLYRVFYAFLSATHRALVLPAGVRVRTTPDTYREPDLVLLLSEDDPRRGNTFWEGADLVAEVVSPDDPARDLVRKRNEYAQAGIPEYWIINPHQQTITVLRLEEGQYVEHGVFVRGDEATSALLPGLLVPVADALDGR
ncbi:MAG: hypothetical protein OHK0022_36510 [Roseiflexaceae bacterium]